MRLTMRTPWPVALAMIIMAAWFFSFLSCATFQQAKEQPFNTWSTKKKLTYAINVYSGEYDSYMAAAIRPDLTDGQKAYLKQKRKALVALDKAIELMIPIADTGGQLPADLESQLLSALSLLGFQPM